MIRSTPVATRHRVSASLVAASLLLAAAPALADDSAAQRGWYAGLGAGVSRLTPDTGQSSLTLDDDASSVVLGWLGRDLTRRLSVEAALSDLGEATLAADTIGYRAASIGLIGHVLGNAERIASREGASLYLRGGMSLIDNESELELEEADNIAIWAGAGVDWPVARSWGVRAELTSYDGDAQAGWLGVYARLRSSGSDDRRNGPARPASVPTPTPAPPATAERPTPAPAPVPAPVPAPAPEPRAQPAPPPAPERAPTTAPVPRTAPAPGAQPADAPRASGAPTGAGSLSSDCAAPAGNEPLDERGCALFAGVLDQVSFLGNTDRLTPVAERSLARLATQLLRHPGTVVEIRAHVAPMLTEAAAQQLSRERAVAVARRLAVDGVPVSQLRARAFGARQPLSSGTGAAGRQADNRIEIGVAR